MIKEPETFGQLEAKFREFARDAYVRDQTTNIYVPKAAFQSMMEPPRSLNSYFDVITAPPTSRFYDEEAQNLQDLTRDELSVAAGILSQQGYHDFTALSEGTTSKVFQSGNVVLRIGAAPTQDPALDREEYLHREDCPLMLQPSLSILSQKSCVLFEVLPYVAMINDADIPELYRASAEQLFEDTGFMLAGDEDKDMAVLPNGTLIYVDPDAITLDEVGVKPTQQDFEQIRLNALMLGYSDDYIWVNRNGGFKQGEYFPQNINKAPQYRI